MTQRIYAAKYLCVLESHTLFKAIAFSPQLHETHVSISPFDQVENRSKEIQIPCLLLSMHVTLTAPGGGGAPGDSAGAERMVVAVRTGQGGEQLGLDQ